MNPKYPHLAFLLIAFAMLAACRTVTYEVELRPNGPVMERIIHVPVGAERIDHVSALYGVQPTADDLAEFEEDNVIWKTFAGEFKHTMPDDVGNDGHFVHVTSSFGTSSAYTERYRGQYDLGGVLELRKKLFDRLCALWLLWLDHTLGDTQDYAQLRHFVDTELRQDVWNMLLLVSSTDTIGRMLVMPDDDSIEDLFGEALAMHFLHYAIERGYVASFDDLLREIDTIDAAADEDAAAIDFVLQAVARAMNGGEPGELSPPLERLAGFSEDDWEAAAESFLQDNEKLEELVADWNATDTDRPEPYRIEDGEFAEHLFEDFLWFELDIFGYRGTLLDIELHLPLEPYRSNGIWEDGFVSWYEELASAELADGDLPNVTYAFWSEPDVDFQMQHFGTIVLDGEVLWEYCRWLPGLTESRRQEWDAFIDSLEPGDDLLPALNHFQFSDESGRGTDRVASKYLGPMLEAVTAAQKEGSQD